jgi:hypothetical protein
MNLPLRLSAIALLLILSACAQTPDMFGGASTLSTDPSDPCHQQRQNFSEGQSYFAQAILAKATQKAVKGAMPSLLNGDVSGAFKGLVGGGIQGIKEGYWDALQQQNQDQQQLAQSMNSDLQRESSAIDHTTAAFASLRACRLAQATRIKTDARLGRIDRAEAQRQLKQEHDWFSEEIDVAQKAGINMQKRDDQFAYAAQSLQKQDTGGHARPRAEAAVTTSATETIPQKRNTFESSVKEAQAESTTAFSLDSNAMVRMRRYA